RGDLTRLIARRSLQENVVLGGFRNNLEQYLPYLDVLALSSFTEGLPVIVLEAMAARVPVVATAVGGVPEVLEDGVSGFLVPPGDATALAAKLGEALRDDERRRAMGEHGRRVV